MAERFQYALWRVVPDIERGERLNVGLVLHCRRHSLLAARTYVDREALAAISPDTNADVIAAHLAGLVAIADGDRSAGSVAKLDRSDRFGWLSAPASTVIQPSPVHTGMCEGPEAELERLFARLVLKQRS